MLESDIGSVERSGSKVIHNAKIRRKHLSDYAAAHRDIELTEAAIELLEKSSALPMVRKLKQIGKDDHFYD